MQERRGPSRGGLVFTVFRNSFAANGSERSQRTVQAMAHRISAIAGSFGQLFQSHQPVSCEALNIFLRNVADCVRLPFERVQLDVCADADAGGSLAGSAGRARSGAGQRFAVEPCFRSSGLPSISHFEASRGYLPVRHGVAWRNVKLRRSGGRSQNGKTAKVLGVKVIHHVAFFEDLDRPPRVEDRGFRYGKSVTVSGIFGDELPWIDHLYERADKASRFAKRQRCVRSWMRDTLLRRASRWPDD